MEKPTYFVSLEQPHDSHQEALEALIDAQDTYVQTKLRITYYMPQPQYKGWVPWWLIRLITK